MDEIQHSRIYNSLDSNDYLRWKINKKDLICSAKCRAWTNSREGIQPASFIAEYLRVDENRVPTVDHVGWRASFFTCFHCGAEATSEETYEEDANKLACNAVVINDTVIFPSEDIEVMEKVRELGLNAVAADVSEFLKSGCACQCLVITLK